MSGATVKEDPMLGLSALLIVGVICLAAAVHGWLFGQPMSSPAEASPME
jgi:hypothetical protein